MVDLLFAKGYVTLPETICGRIAEGFVIVDQ